MKRLLVLIMGFLITMCIFPLTACNNQAEDMLTTASIYFPDGTVKEYKTPSDINPFYELQVSFYGEPNKGFVEINTENCPEIVKDNFTFICENNGNLKNGGKAKIKVEYDEPLFTRAGYNITCTDREYTVTGVEFYPSTIEEYNKDKLNKSIRRAADTYINDNIENIDMEFESKNDRNGWSKSGSCDYSYNYCDITMIYNVNKNDSSQNMYFIIYELSNYIECKQSMDYTAKDPMLAGEDDTGWAYVVVGASGVTAKSDKEFSNNVEYETIKSNIKTFTTLEQAEQYCTYGGEYKTFVEDFV